MLKWVKIDVIMEESEYPPPFFVGSMFRGAFGMALKRVVCINPSYRCEGCFAAKECLYHQFYEEKNVEHPFRFDIVLQPKGFDFSLYLFEDATTSLPYVLSAVKKAFEEQGLGNERRKVRIRQIAVGRTIVYDGKDFLSLEGVELNELKSDTFCPDVEIEFTMPLRIKENNRFARERVQLHTLVNNIHRRYRMLKGEPAEKLNYRVEGEVSKQQMRYVEMRRYSNRQRQQMNMGGIKGTMKITGLDEQSYRYLKIGEIIGAGKQTVFGLGVYEMKELK